MNKEKIRLLIPHFFLATIFIIFVITLIIFPKEAFQASLRGLNIWWEVVFPALLPFFITSEIIIGLGIVQFLGVLFEPIMRPIFRVPGVGGFALVMGFASGYPMGAKITTRLREQKLISKVEGERLVSFTTTSDPIFMLGAVAVGFFHDPKFGIFIMLIHFLSSIILGILMRFYNKGIMITPKNSYKTNILIRALKTMVISRQKDGRKMGKLMGDAVMNSLTTITMVGGFIIFFSVILEVLVQTGIIPLLQKILIEFLLLFNFDPNLSYPIISGFFEVTLGAKSISDISSNLTIEKIAILQAIIAWGGISVHAQIAAILNSSDLSYKPFFFAKILHSFIAIILSWIMWEPLKPKLTSLSLVFSPFYSTNNNNIFSYIILNWYYYSFVVILLLVIIPLILYKIYKSSGKSFF